MKGSPSELFMVNAAGRLTGLQFGFLKYAATANTGC